MQTNDKATTANNLKTPGATFSGRYMLLGHDQRNCIFNLLLCIFLFRFPSGAILDLGMRSSRSNAPRPMRQVSSSYSLLLPCHLFACHAFHIMSSCASHLHMCSSHASEHFSRCPFRHPTLLCPSEPPFASFRVRVLHFLGMDRDLPSGLGTLL